MYLTKNKADDNMWIVKAEIKYVKMVMRGAEYTMTNLQLILRQKIGIFYRDKKWAEKIFNKIYDYYHSLDMIDRIYGTTWSNSKMIRLKDNTEIVFVRAAENARGHCFSKVILQPGIDEELINCVIKHTLKDMSCRCCMVLNDNDGIEFIY